MYEMFDGFCCYLLTNVDGNLILFYFWVLKEEMQRTNLEWDSFKEKIKENQEKIKLNKQLPYLVGNIVEVISLFICR